jgi:biopolymer transport protein ExbB
MLWLSVVEWLSRLIFVFLIGLSFWSITIIIERRRFFRSLSLPGDELKSIIKSKKKTFNGNSLYAEMMRELSPFEKTEQIEKAFDAFIFEKKKNLEKGLPILGTLGSTTPFVGLLGTILGIIVSFGELSQGSGSSNTVMFSLAEALILTAVGLIVAIPAVVAFNYFNRKVKMILAEATGLKDLFIAYKE